MIAPNLDRPFIYLNAFDEIHHSREGKLKVVLTKDKIHIGCTDVSVDVLKHLLVKWNQSYKDIPTHVTLQ